jgi:hypothetical protein
MRLPWIPPFPHSCIFWVVMLACFNLIERSIKTESNMSILRVPRDGLPESAFECNWNVVSIEGNQYLYEFS